MFNGEKLQELRLLYGMSRAELAEKLDITEQAVWQFETNKVKPKVSPTVLSLSKLFKVDIRFFEGEVLSSCVNRGSIAFRNEDIASKKTIQMQEVYINAVHALIGKLENYLSSPPKVIYSLVQEVEDLLAEKLLSNDVIVEISELARKRLGISIDNNDLLYQIEMSGINVLSRFMPFGSSSDAYSLWTTDGVPYLVLAIGKSYARRNFDLAHELGHLLLHRAVDFELLDNAEHERREQEANFFASNLLLPDKEFKRSFELLVGTRVSQPDRYIGLKQHFNVSIQALEYKAYRLGYLTPAQNSYFYRQIHKKGYKFSEPLDSETPVYKPGKILSMLDIVLSNNLTDIQSLLYSLRISKEMMAQILNVESSFFDKYKSSLNDYSKIIKLIDQKEA
ncbi:ImmA/IrrE family metallo-endopeptidase [Lactococcus lactis]|uniref:spr1629 family repressor/antitoxin n=1 Tax=Lactococcus lactis TaxID=1358 RepID=UPI00050C754A|nr:XRE family transcriptional regulator [Lactococcus lactis]MCT3086033.1 ImmA/IrrE family metallo-endopeptidase [Lactococcus lactis]MCT3123957.1 ImmA/IrrE family metallo-endopeptidase [Lactococcus lactis]MCT3130266.1 ImmA/IrrE family metallo-endopeptidase [Lactococcus lactis]UPG98558.1 XRE family transcriptional regulator [Lactococcus lactis]GEB08769.1 transcriptional regulator [Lactococcus lactis subsp. lactis]